MGFTNRVSEHLNRKRLVVQDTTKNAAGEITSMIVDVERSEGNVSTEGTKLNATNLTNEITSIVNNQCGSIINSCNNNASNINTLNSRVGSAEGNINNLSSRIGSAEGNISSLQNQFNNINSEVEDMVDERMNYHQFHATTQPTYDSSNLIATTRFVWEALAACGITPSHGGGGET